MAMPKVVILGAGPAGLGAAWRLARESKAEVVVLEQRNDVGGNAGSFSLAGIPVDFGSHRLHPSCPPNILADIRGLLGDDLLDRPRHGRIRLCGRWIHFPLKALDLMTNVPWSFRFGVARDAARKILPWRRNSAEPTFASELEQGLGHTICRSFYFPYARKIWGLAPVELSPIQARRRVSAGSLTKMVRKILRRKSSTGQSGRFYYPRQGFGQISTALAAAATGCGVAIRTNAAVHRVSLDEAHRVEFEHNGTHEMIEADHVWSTIPITVLAGLVAPAAPPFVVEAGRSLASRAMVLVYLVLAQRQFTEYDAHYFPEADIPLTRLSEPKNYSERREPGNCTVLCAEMPCTVGDELWQQSDAALADIVHRSLHACGLPIKSAVIEVAARRLPHAYPIYRQGYEAHFAALDGWADNLKGVLSFGRQGLFAHDNTHHALAMAYAAVDCLSGNGQFDRERWCAYRTQFESHVVED